MNPDKSARWTAAGVLAGAVAPALLAAVVVTFTIRERAFLSELGWDPLRRTPVGWPSVLALTEDGWLISATFVVTGALGLLFAAALIRVVPAAAAKTDAAAIGVVAVVLMSKRFARTRRGRRGARGTAVSMTPPIPSWSPPRWPRRSRSGADFAPSAGLGGSRYLRRLYSRRH